MLVEALRLADLGWQVFALNPEGIPWGNCDHCRDGQCSYADLADCPCLLCHGAWAGTADPDRLEQMWSLNPNSLLGVHCGPASGVVVLDFDQHSDERDGLKARRQMVREGVLPPTVVARTGGGGFHYYFRYPSDTPTIRNNNRGRVALGVDVKSTGGFVIAPPSRKLGRSTSYVWLADPWSQPLAEVPVSLLTRMLDEPETQPQDSFIVNLTPEDLQDGAFLAKLVSEASPGFRNDRLYRAACRAGEAIAAGFLPWSVATTVLTQVGLEVGLRPREVRGTIQSGLRTGLRSFTS